MDGQFFHQPSRHQPIFHRLTFQAVGGLVGAAWPLNRAFRLAGRGRRGSTAAVSPSPPGGGTATGLTGSSCPWCA